MARVLSGRNRCKAFKALGQLIASVRPHARTQIACCEVRDAAAASRDLLSRRLGREAAPRAKLGQVEQVRLVRHGGVAGAARVDDVARGARVERRGALPGCGRP